jgi:hypothetical protein
MTGCFPSRLSQNSFLVPVKITEKGERWWRDGKEEFGKER